MVLPSESSSLELQVDVKDSSDTLCDTQLAYEEQPLHLLRHLHRPLRLLRRSLHTLLPCYTSQLTIVTR